MPTKRTNRYFLFSANNCRKPISAGKYNSGITGCRNLAYMKSPPTRATNKRQYDAVAVKIRITDADVGSSNISRKRPINFSSLEDFSLRKRNITPANTNNEDGYQ